MFDDIPRPTCRSVYTVSDKHLRHGGSGYETSDEERFQIIYRGIGNPPTHAYTLYADRAI